MYSKVVNKIKELIELRRRRGSTRYLLSEIDRVDDIRTKQLVKAIKKCIDDEWSTEDQKSFELIENICLLMN